VTNAATAAIARRVGEDDEFARKYRRYQMGAWLVTFLQYVVYHMTRRPYSVVKSAFVPDSDQAPGREWQPFVGAKGKKLLGLLDTLYLASYAVALFGAGHVADRSDLRVFLAIGLLGVGLGLSLWPIGFALDIHSIVYYAAANIFTGIMQATGWPAVVAVMSNWFAKGSRGCVMGVWNAHTSIGNVLGVVLATSALKMGSTSQTGVPGWVFAFAMPSIVTVLMSVLSYFALVPTPEEATARIDAADAAAGILTDDATSVHALSASDAAAAEARILSDAELSDHTVSMAAVFTSTAGYALPEGAAVAATAHAPGAADSVADDDGAAAAAAAGGKKKSGISFMTALLIPGVLEFSFVLFFTKLVAYTFLFWLPSYLESTGYEPSVSGYLSTTFDVGGIVGGIIVGFLSDRTGRPAVISCTALLCTVPTLLLFRTVSAEHFGGVGVTVVVMMLLGMLVNGPYALITTAVSADLGSHPALGDDATALATVSGIIDGFGTAGAAAQGIIVALVAGDAEGDGGWNRVFYLLMGACCVAALLLARLVHKDITSICAARRARAEADAAAAAEYGDAAEEYAGAGMAVGSGSLVKPRHIRLREEEPTEDF
jgi:OPA family glycerol-3-phosphate transporter-like MFS transporter 1/2